MDRDKWEIERLSDSVVVYQTATWRFGEDALLLAAFARPKAGERVCDLGTGNGVLPLWWYTQADVPCHVDAVDIQPDGVRLTAAAVEDSGLGDKITAIEADWNNLPPSLPPGGYDRVTCNPPYFAAGGGRKSRDESERLRRHEPSPSLLADLCRAAARLLKPGGAFCLCHRPERLCDVLQALRGAGLEPKCLRFVCGDKGGTPWLFLCEARRGGRPGLTVSVGADAG